MEKLPIDTFLEIINNVNVETMLSLRVLCKKLNENISCVRSLSLEQTSSYLTHFKDFKAKYNVLTKIMPNLKSMKIHLIINPKDILSEHNRLSPIRIDNKETENASLLAGHERGLSFRDYYLFLFSWLSDIKINIDCSMESRDSHHSSTSYQVSSMMNHLLFNVRRNFKINKYRQDVKDYIVLSHPSDSIIFVGPKPRSSPCPIIEFKTCFKMKDGILTIAHGMQKDSDKVIYSDIRQYGVKCSEYKIWDEVRGIKIKHPHRMTTCYNPVRGSPCNTQVSSRCPCKCGRWNFNKVYVDTDRLHDKIKGLPITFNKGCVMDRDED